MDTKLEKEEKIAFIHIGKCGGTSLVNQISKYNIYQYHIKNKNDIFKYPLIYTINKQNEITFRYTNDNTKGHFNRSKFIFSNGAGFYCDVNEIMD